MKQELKLRIKSPEQIELLLTQLGAKFVSERNVVDTYFNQPGDDVLKITQDERGVFINTLKSNGAGFDILPKLAVENLEESMNSMSSKFGIQTILRKKVRHFEYKSYQVTLNLIDEVGDFLVVEGDKVEKSTIKEEFKINSPEFITVPFNKVS